MTPVQSWGWGCSEKSENNLQMCVHVSCSVVPDFATAWTVAHQAPLSMRFSRQEHWSGLPFPSLGDRPDPRIQPGSPALQADSLPSGGTREAQLMDGPPYLRLGICGFSNYRWYSTITFTTEKFLHVKTLLTGGFLQALMPMACNLLCKWIQKCLWSIVFG